MKTGPVQQRLSERLAQKLEIETEETAASIESGLERFKNDYESIVRSALNTISADTELLLIANRERIRAMTDLMAAEAHRVQRMLRFTPLILALCVAVLIVPPLAASYYWLTPSTPDPSPQQLTNLGLRIDRQGGSTIISWDPLKLSQINCTTGDPSPKKVPCLVSTSR